MSMTRSVVVGSPTDNNNRKYPGPGFSGDPSGYGAPPVEELVVLVLVNLVCLLFISYRNKKELLLFVPEQAISIFVGVLFGGAGRLFGHSGISQELMHNFSGIFFEFCLPPIIFSSAYSIKRKAFFKNLGGIMCFAIFGTIISSFLIGWGVYFFYGTVLDILGATSLKQRELPLVDALILGSLLSAVDPIATLAILPETVNRQVYALLFGESVLNDAVAIVLYNGFILLHNEIHGRAASSGKPFSEIPIQLSDYGMILIHFVIATIGSMILGTIIGLLSALALKHGGLHDYPGKEQALILLFAYMSYLIARASSLSPVMSLFTTGAIMSHYAYYNLSRMSQIATASSFSCIANVAETFVFVFLGISVFSVLFVNDFAKDVTLVFMLVFLCFFTRLLQISLLSGVVNLTKYLTGGSGYISIPAQVFLSWSGLRGAVSFALALHAPVLNSKGTIITTTISVILFTFIIQGTTSQYLAGVMGLADEPALDEEELFPVLDKTRKKSGLRSPSVYLEEAASPRTAAFVGLRSASNVDYGYFATLWRSFDDKYMKPLFGGRPREELLMTGIHGGVSFNEESFPEDQNNENGTAPLVLRLPEAVSGSRNGNYGSFFSK